MCVKRGVEFLQPLDGSTGGFAGVEVVSLRIDRAKMLRCSRAATAVPRKGDDRVDELRQCRVTCAATLNAGGFTNGAARPWSARIVWHVLNVKAQ